MQTQRMLATLFQNWNQKRALLGSMLTVYDMTVKVIMNLKHTYSEAVSKLIIREFRLQLRKDKAPLALVTRVQPQQRPQQRFFVKFQGILFVTADQEKKGKERSCDWYVFQVWRNSAHC